MRLIDGDSLVGLIKIRLSWHTDYSIDEVIQDIKDAPEINTVNKNEIRTGEWITVEVPRFGNPYRHYKCSRCGNPVPYKVRYCDSCGSLNRP